MRGMSAFLDSCPFGGFAMKSKLIAFFIEVGVTLTAVSTCYADDSAAPNVGLLRDDFFVPELSAVCGLGELTSQGCQAIRDREIVDASELPWKAIGRVNFASRQLRQHCTGTLLSEQIVVTASHCLYNFARKSWVPAESIRFVAGYQRGSFEAISDVDRYILDPVHDPGSRDFTADAARDWALLVLKEPIGRNAGTMAPYLEDITQIKNASFALAGYSGLRPHVLSIAQDCGVPEYKLNLQVLSQECSAMHGDSGAPSIVHVNGKMAVWGVFVGVYSNRSDFVSISIPISRFSSALASELDKLR